VGSEGRGRKTGTGEAKKVQKMDQVDVHGIEKKEKEGLKSGNGVGHWGGGTKRVLREGGIGWGSAKQAQKPGKFGSKWTKAIMGGRVEKQEGAAKKNTAKG